MALIKPQEYYESTYQIPFEGLAEKGFRGVIFDIDNTLVYHGAPANINCVRLFKRIAACGLKTCLISNNHESRVKPFADEVGAQYIYDAKKPLSKGYLKGCQVMGIKPSETVFVGDQLFTDILGSNRSGLHSILVKPIFADPELQIQIKRLLEKPFLNCFGIHYKKIPKDNLPLYVLIGNPLGHTKFPELHTTINYQTDVDALAEKYEVHEPLSDVIKHFHEKRVPGVSVTMPFKQEVIPLLAHIDEDALAAGAVNTLVWHIDGYHGYNTDIPGLTRCLELGGIDITDRDVLLIGAGGAAKAASIVCRNKKVRSLTIINRTREYAEMLANNLRSSGCAFPVTVLTYDESGLADCPEYIAIQCTGLGMDDKQGMLPPLSDELYKKISAACDAIYNPPETAFLSRIREQGGTTVNGYNMFYYQAVAARDLWNLPS